MPAEREDLAYYLCKAEDYRKKANVVSEPRLKAALLAVAEAYKAKAIALDPTLPSNSWK